MAAILALETSSDACSVALRVGETVYLEEHDEARAHARVLLPTIEGLLREAGLACADLDGILYGCGPGSFTGLRIGCAVAQGLAWAHELPTLGVSSLALLAEVALRDADAAAVGVLTVLDARMDECYVAAFAADAPRTGLAADRIVPRAELDAFLTAAVEARPGRWRLAGDAVGAEAAAASALEFVAGLRPDARALLDLGAPRLAAEGVPASEVHPVYLRDESRWRRQGS